MLQCDVERTCRHPFALTSGFKWFFSAVSLAGLVLRCFQNNLEASCCRDAQKVPKIFDFVDEKPEDKKVVPRVWCHARGLSSPRHRASGSQGAPDIQPSPLQTPRSIPQVFSSLGAHSPRRTSYPYSALLLTLSVHTHLVPWPHHQLPSTSREVQVAHFPPPLHLPAAPSSILQKLLKVKSQETGKIMTLIQIWKWTHVKDLILLRREPFYWTHEEGRGGVIQENPKNRYIYR